MNFKALFLTAAVAATTFVAAPANANNLPACAEMENSEMACTDNGRTFHAGAIDACYSGMASDFLQNSCQARISRSQSQQAARDSVQAHNNNNGLFTFEMLGALNGNGGGSVGTYGVRTQRYTDANGNAVY